jgi:hypothetical protein
MTEITSRSFLIWLQAASGALRRYAASQADFAYQDMPFLPATVRVAKKMGA